MSKRRKLPRVPPTPKGGTLNLLPLPRAGAGEQIRLGLRLRNEANLTGRCACGAERELFVVQEDGSFVPVNSIEPGTVVYGRFQHEDDCPAISPELARAYERGEIADPGGDLLRGIMRKEAAEP